MTTRLVAIFLFLAHPALSFIDYCRNHTFDRPNNSEILHFSKENIDRDFGIYDKFKCLHCCCHGYRSIEWFKDGTPYPWPTNVSTLIIRPESGNQTICSHQSTPVDSGRYWCIATNDTHFLRHEVTLQLSGPSISMGWPKTTYSPKEQKANRGEPVRFFCEAFVGTIDLPDFHSEITWERYDQNQSFIDGERVVQEAVFREEKRILGSYLYFKEVVPEDYGEYTCKVRNLADQVLRLNTWLKRKEELLEQTDREVEAFWVSFSLIGLLIVIATISTVCLYRFSSLRSSRASGCVEVANKDALLKSQMCKLGKIWPTNWASTEWMENGAARAFITSHKSCKKVHCCIGCILLEVLPTPKAESTESLLLEYILSIDSHNGSDSFKCWN